MACTSHESNPTTTTDDSDGATTISAIHSDIIQTHILTRLDGPTLLCAAATSSQLRALSFHEDLWANICYSTWPSTNAPRVRHVISSFPNRSCSFFSDSFPASRPSPTDGSRINLDRTTELISAVDLFHCDNLILSKVIETKTDTGKFRSSPFRIDVIDPNETIHTPVEYLVTDDTCCVLFNDLRLSWILIDPAGRRAVNVSSRKAVTVHRDGLTEEVLATFATVVSGGEAGTVACSAVVNWGREMQARELSLQIEDMDGNNLNGRDSLVILQRALEGKREKVKDWETNVRYWEFMKEKWETNKILFLPE